MSVSIKTTLGSVTHTVEFTTHSVKTQVSENKIWCSVTFVMRRSDTGEERLYKVLIPNELNALDSLALVERGSVEDQWERPHLKYKDPSKEGGWAFDIAFRISVN